MRLSQVGFLATRVADRYWHHKLVQALDHKQDSASTPSPDALRAIMGVSQIRKAKRWPPALMPAGNADVSKNGSLSWSIALEKKPFPRQGYLFAAHVLWCRLQVGLADSDKASTQSLMD
jgi:hypothetical protein